MNLLALRRVEKGFDAIGNALANPVLGGIDLEVAAGERIAIIGPSGCGKTTLLNLIAGLVRLDGGQINRAPDCRLSYMFQEPRLLPWRTVSDNLTLVLPEGASADQRATSMLSAVGLAGASGVFASNLSLGMARRVALARAFIVEPDLLLMDEPFVSLDVVNAARLRTLLLDLLRARDAAMLFVSHDLREAIMVSDRLVFFGSPPSRIRLDVPVPLTVDERLNEKVRETFRSELIEAHNVDALSLELSGQLRSGRC